MKMIVLGGDARFRFLEPGLARLGIETVAPREEADTYLYGGGASALPVLEFPPGATVLLLSPDPLPEGFAPGLRVINLLEDEAFAQENARLTAEGAISAAMNRMIRCLWRAKVVVLGYGRIGRWLTELLVPLGAEVTVVSGREVGRRQAMSRGAEAVASEELCAAIADAELIFSTPPALVLDEIALRCARRDALVVDLASAPYGVDLGAAVGLGIEAWRESGVPGRYCPKSAAEALISAIARALHRKEVSP